MTASGDPARLARPVLARRLRDALTAGSVLLVAEAGYGKTSVLEEALGNEREGVAWLRCTRRDRDPASLLAGLIEAIRRAAPGIADVLAQRLESATEAIGVGLAVEALTRELERLLLDRLIVVLDDTEHLAEAPEAAGLVEALLVADIPTLHWAIATRRPLPLRLAKLRTAGRVTEFAAADLGFSAAECSALLGRRWQREVGNHELGAVMRSTEGWPLAVGLAAAGEPGTLPAEGSHEAVFEFLAEEVLDRLEPARAEAVLDSSLSPALSPQVAEALGLPGDFLPTVEGLGIFLRPGGEWRWSHYHPLFRQFLLRRLHERRSADELRSLHARLAPALADSGRGADAVEHWLAAGEWEHAVVAISRESAALLRLGPATVKRWLERLPETVHQEPGVRLLEGSLAAFEGSTADAVHALRAAAEGFRRRGDATSDWLARLRLADALVWALRFDEVVELSDGFDAEEGRAASPLAAGVALYAAIALGYQARARESKKLAGRALAQPGAGGLPSPALIQALLVDLPAGRLDPLTARARQVVDQAQVADPLNPIVYSIAVLAQALEEQGHDEEALVWWHRADEIGEGDELSRWIVRMSAAFRATIHARGGRLAEAELELARLTGSEPGPPLQAAFLHEAAAMAAALRGDAGETVKLVERALGGLAGRAVVYWLRMSMELAPALVRCGERSHAREVVEDALAVLDERLPGEEGRFYRARVLALRAWLRHAQGERAWPDDLRQSWGSAGDAVHHLLRREWPRLDPLLSPALEAGALEPAGVVAALSRAGLGPAALLPLTRHPEPKVRAAAAVLAVESGNPEVTRRLDELAADPDRAVAVAAREATERLADSPPPLSFELLGGFEVRRGAWQIPWGRPLTARVLRFLLINRDRLVNEDELFEAFWPGKPAATARRNLQVAVSLTRAALDLPGGERSVLAVRERTYRLELGVRDRVDVDEFEAAARTALAHRGTERRRLLERADGLWRGEPLPEDRYEPWSIPWRERLVDRQLELLAALVAAAREAGDLPAAIAAARRLVALDPLSEAGHRELMALYARTGRRGHALRQYLECRRLLVDELGVEPAEQTALLQARILAGESV